MTGKCIRYVKEDNRNIIRYIDDEINHAPYWEIQVDNSNTLYDLIQARISREGVMSMSKGDKMLKEAGYEKYLDNEDTLIYKYERETFKVSLVFDKRPFKKTFYATEGLWVANNDGWYAQEFKNEWDKYCSAQGYWSHIWHEFSMEELQAINEKCKELGLKED